MRNWVIGIDEVGRGPIAGPVTVCLFASKRKINTKIIFKDGVIRDSKKLKKVERIGIYKTIRELRKTKSGTIEWHISSRSAKYIDRHGITKSISSCISSCLTGIRRKGVNIANAVIWLDGGLKINKHRITTKLSTRIIEHTVIKGDETILNIALASIIAKVTRDSYMGRMAINYPNYGWLNNVGYGTREHYNAIEKHGLCIEHRVKFVVIKPSKKQKVVI